MLIGYARVSTRDQDTEAQIAALEESGCELIFKEKASGARWERPELNRLFGHLRKGDVLVIWKLDRLSRSLKDLLTLMEKIVGSFAEFECAMLRERTRNGLDAARKQGRIGGRRPKLKTNQKAEIVELVNSGKKTAADAAKLFGVHPSTVSRLMQRVEKEP